MGRLDGERRHSRESLDHVRNCLLHVLLLHRPDPLVEPEEVAKAFTELQRVTASPSTAAAILEAAEEAQLVVLGRHPAGVFGGFAFGSVARAVLHYAETPVMVVPAEDGHRED